MKLDAQVHICMDGQVRWTDTLNHIWMGERMDDRYKG